MSSSPSAWKFLRENAITVAPVIAYYLTFVFESAKCRVLGLPIEFVDVQFTQVLLVLFLVLGLGSFLIFFLDDALDVVTPTEQSQNAPRVGRQYGMLIGYLFLLAQVYNYQFSKIIFPAAAVGTLAALDFASATWRDKSLPFFQRLLGPLGILTAEGQALGVLKRRFGGYFPIIVAFLLASHLSYHLGRARMYTQRDFLVPSIAPDTVVVARYGTLLFCGELNRVSREVTGDYSVIDLESTENLQLAVQHLGPLTFSSSSKSAPPSSADSPASVPVAPALPNTQEPQATPADGPSGTENLD